VFRSKFSTLTATSIPFKLIRYGKNDITNSLCLWGGNKSGKIFQIVLLWNPALRKGFHMAFLCSYDRSGKVSCICIRSLWKLRALGNSGLQLAGKHKRKSTAPGPLHKYTTSSIQYGHIVICIGDKTDPLLELQCTYKQKQRPTRTTIAT